MVDNEMILKVLLTNLNIGNFDEYVVYGDNHCLYSSVGYSILFELKLKGKDLKGFHAEIEIVGTFITCAGNLRICLIDYLNDHVYVKGV